MTDENINPVDAVVDISLRGKELEIHVPKGDTILEAAQEAGIHLPHSCQAGICGTCRAKLKTGDVHMRSCMALDEKDIEKGLILCCQAMPLTEKVVLKYEN